MQFSQWAAWTSIGGLVHCNLGPCCGIRIMLLRRTVEACFGEFCLRCLAGCLTPINERSLLALAFYGMLHSSSFFVSFLFDFLKGVGL